MQSMILHNTTITCFREKLPGVGVCDGPKDETDVCAEQVRRQAKKLIYRGASAHFKYCSKNLDELYFVWKYR